MSNHATLTSYMTGRAISVDNATNLGTEAIKVAPPASAIALHLYGIALSDWVYIFTLIYTVGLCIQTFWRFG